MFNAPYNALAILDQLIAEQEKQLDWLDDEKVLEEIARGICESEGLIPDTEASMGIYAWQLYLPEAKAAIATIKRLQKERYAG